MTTMSLADARTRLISEAARLEVLAAAARQDADYADCHLAYQTAMEEARITAGNASILRSAIGVLERLEARGR